jgi:hypothetical protein
MKDDFACFHVFVETITMRINYYLLFLSGVFIYYAKILNSYIQAVYAFNLRHFALTTSAEYGSRPLSQAELT